MDRALPAPAARKGTLTAVSRHEEKRAQLYKFLQVADLPLRRAHLTPLGLKPARKGVLNVIAASQSSFLRAASRGVHKEHKDFAAIVVATAMLSATNSFLWNGASLLPVRTSFAFRSALTSSHVAAACRGPGLCYGLSIDLNDDAGHLSLSVRSFIASTPLLPWHDVSSSVGPCG